MDLIEKYLPKTYYAGLNSEYRLKMLVESWQRAITVNQELEAKKYVSDTELKANGEIKQIIRDTIDEYFLDIENCNYVKNLTFKDKINFVKLVLLDIKVKIVSRLPC